MTSFLGIDVGTSSVKAVLLDPSQAVLAEASLPLTVSRPRPLWSEQNPEDWWQATLGAVAAVRQAAPEAFAGLEAIGLSGQMHGAVLLGADHEVLRPAIIWNDGRSEPQCAELLRRVPDFTTRAANIPMPGFTAPKLVWVAEHEPDVFAKTRLVLLPKDYVRLRLTGAAVSEMSDAAGTLWLDVGKRAWDDTLLSACGLDRSHMPSLVEGSEVSADLSAGLAADWGLAGRKIPVAGGGGDNAASAVGIGAVRTGEGFLSLGTSGVLFSVTDRLAALPERTLHAFCHALPGRWHGMAVVLAAASALSWVAGVTGHADDIGGLVGKAEAFAADRGRREHAPLFLPYLTGERTPYNDAGATGMFQGLRAEHGADAMAYAVLEGVAFGFADGLDVFNAANLPLTSCLLVGGGSRSAFWTQMIADVLQVPLDLPSGAELGAAFGAARLGMLAAGAGSEADVCTRPPIRRTFAPDAGAPALFQPRLARFRALYAAEKGTRDAR